MGWAAVVFASYLLLSLCAVTHAQNQFLTITPIDLATTSGGAAFGRNPLLTVGSYQLSSYYDADGFVKIARRKKLHGGGWSDWIYRTTKFKSFDPKDGHNVITTGVDGSGFFHITWGVHNNALQYTRSRAPILNDEPFELVQDTAGNDPVTGVLGHEIPVAGSSVTYPEWYNVPNSGDLILTYRSGGGSGSGNYQMARWNDKTRTWSAIHAANPSTTKPSNNPQPWMAKNAPNITPLHDVSAYLHGIVWDSTGRLHTSWVWRTLQGLSTNGSKGYQTNHNIMYAYSDDQGTTWKQMDGTILQRNGRHAIDEQNARPIMELPEGSSLINQGTMAVDPQNRPMIATWFAPEAVKGNHLRQFMLVWWDGAKWRSNPISHRQSENNDQRVERDEEFAKYKLPRPCIFIDKAGRIIVLYFDWQRDCRCTLAYTESPDRDVWSTIDITTEVGFKGDPRIDDGRWIADQVIALQAKPKGADKLSVYEFDWGKFISQGKQP